MKTAHSRINGLMHNITLAWAALFVLDVVLNIFNRFKKR
jgi:hypothetical protein